MSGIAHRLNAEGLQAMNDGRYWIPHSIREKLKNPAYNGTFRWNDIEIRDNHPAIIDVADFETVQRLLGERQAVTTPKRDGGDFLFTSLLRCGKCESAMHGYANGPRLYYWCQGHKTKGSAFCDLNAVKQNELLGYVVETIEQHWMNPLVVKALREELHRLVEGDHPKVSPDRLQAQLATLDAKLTKARKRLLEVDADMLPDVQAGIRELRAQREQLETALRAASTPRKALFADVDERIDRAVSAFCGLRGVLESADPVHRRETIRQTVHHIDVWAERNSGRKNNFRLDHGLITLRDDNLFTSPD